MKLLEKETEKARKATSNKYFKFNKREFLLDQPRSKLYTITKECKITHYRKLALWSLVTKMLEQPNITEIIYKLLVENRAYKIDEEDLEAMKDGRYRL